MAIYGPDEFLCIMYYDDFACPWHDERNDYNNVWAYPSIFFNGQDYSETGEEFTEYVEMFSDWIDFYLAQPSLLRMSVDLEIVGDTGTVTGNIEALDTVPEAYVYVAIYEDPGPRQPHVVHWFPVYAEPLTAMGTGQTQQVSGTFTVDDA